MIRLIGALLAEQTDEWAVARRYMSLDSLTKQRHDQPPATDPRLAIEAATTDEEEDIDTAPITDL